MKQTNRLEISNKLRISPRLRESLAILSAPVYTLETVLDEYAANPLLQIESPFRQSIPANGDMLRQAKALETTSLEAHLFEQINLLQCTEADRRALYLIASMLDDKGFFTALPGTVAKQTGLNPSRVEQLLRLFQTLDPPGIGAIDYRQSIKRQLRLKGQLTNDAALIIDKYLPLLADRDFNRIKEETGTDPDQSKLLLSRIKKLHPYPAHTFSISQPVTYIEPDIIVEEANGDLYVRLNPATLFHIRINEAEYRFMSRGLNPQEVRFVNGLYQQARWLKAAVLKRYETLLKIAGKLCDLQRGYFLHGGEAMAPLTKKSLASALGLHASTVSRALHEKYIKSAQGVNSASHFFRSCSERFCGYSPMQIKHFICRLVSQENKFYPESDEKIAACLNAAGIEISRRTVSKYRLSIGISPVHIRREKIN